MIDHPSQWIVCGLTCRTVMALASGYLDHRLPRLLRVRGSLRLVSCPHCLTYVLQIRWLCETLGRFP